MGSLLDCTKLSKWKWLVTCGPGWSGAVVAHNLLEARALIEAVGPKRLYLQLRNFARCARVPRPCARRARSAAEGFGGVLPPSVGSRCPGAAAPLDWRSPSQALKARAFSSSPNLPKVFI